MIEKEEDKEQGQAGAVCTLLGKFTSNMYITGNGPSEAPAGPKKNETHLI